MQIEGASARRQLIESYLANQRFLRGIFPPDV
jgi:hypothetical protein